MQNYNYPQTPVAYGSNNNDFVIYLMFKIAGLLAIVFFLFLPVAGVNNVGFEGGGSVNGWDMISGFFKPGVLSNLIKSGTTIDIISLILLLLSGVCGGIMVFFKKPPPFIICGIAGIITFLVGYFLLIGEFTKMAGEFKVDIGLKIGAYLALLLYGGIAVGALIKLMAGNKNKIAPPLFNAPPVVYPQQQQQQQPYQQPMQQQYQAPPPPQPPIQQQYQAPPPQYQVPPQPQYQTPPPPQQMQQQATKQKFCSKCGFKFPDNYTGKFCGKCGTQRIF